jgi:hypothetical protein
LVYRPKLQATPPPQGGHVFGLEAPVDEDDETR